MSTVEGLRIYIGCNLRMLRGMFRARPGTTGFTAAGIAVALVAVGAGANELAGLLGRLALQPRQAIAGMVPVVVFAGLLLGLLTVVVALFERRQIEELERLRALPFTSGALFGFKLIDLSPIVLLGAYLLAPLLHAISSRGGIGAGGQALLLAGFFAILLQVLFLLLSGTIVLVELLPARIVRLRWLLGGAALLGMLLVGLALVDGTAGPILSSLARLLPQQQWIGELLEHERRSVLRGAASLAGSTALLGLLAWWLYTRLFLERFESLLAKLRDPGAGRPAPDRASGQLSALLQKEWRQTSRDRAFWLAAGMIGAVLLLPMAPLLALGLDADGIPALAYLALAGLVWTNVLAFLALSSVGREGLFLEPLSWLPLCARRILRARVLFYGGLLAVSGAPWLGAMGALAGAPAGWSEPVWCGLLGASGALFWFALAALAVSIGAVFSRPESHNPYRRVSLVGAGVFLACELLLLATALGLLFCGLLAPGSLPVAGGLALFVWGVVWAVVGREARRALRLRADGRLV